MWALGPVQTLDEIRVNVDTFNDEANHSETYYQRAGTCVCYTTYWVYYPEKRSFGPGKFVGFTNMNFEHYEHAPEEFGKLFDGARARAAIEETLGAQFTESPILSEQLVPWAESLLEVGVFRGVTRSKWRFLSLPRIRSQRRKVG